MSSGAVAGPVRTWLRLEGAAVLVAAAWAYATTGASWLTFLLLFFVPDLSMIGYLAGPRAGAFLYNIVHSYAAPLLVGATLLASGGSIALVLIWIAHIGFDRALGYGLKYPTGFGATHLGTIGRTRAPE